VTHERDRQTDGQTDRHSLMPSLTVFSAKTVGQAYTMAYRPYASTNLWRHFLKRRILHVVESGD